MSDVPDFAPPHHLGNRSTEIRPGSQNSRSSDGAMTVSYGLDEGMLVEFFEEPLYMEYLSKSVGHPIHRLNIMTRIVQPGNRNTVWCHQTKGIVYEMLVDPESGEYHTNWDIQEVCDNGDPPEPSKYPNAWAKFMRKGISSDVGLPIEQWGTVSRSYAESLKMQHIHSVEALAQLTDQAAQSIMGAVKYRDLARAYLDDRQKSAIVAKEQERASRFEEQASQLAKQVEALQQHVMLLQTRLNGADMPAPDPRRMGQGQVAEQLGIYNQAEGTRQMSVGEAKKKHKIPPRDKAA